MSFASAAQPSSRRGRPAADSEQRAAADIEGVAIELHEDDPASAAEDVPEAPVRALTVPRTASELEAWRGELRTIAVVAAGSLAAGVATVAAAGVAKSVGSRATRRSLRRRRDRDIVATRSFLVDVHLLGR